MRIIPLGFLVLCVACGNSNNGPSCPANTSYKIDTGATLSYTPGVDAGYYISYGGGGHWHFEWTCDTKLSAQGCNFTGSVTADTPVTATCYMCEPTEDQMSTTVQGASTTIDFDTITAGGIDGLDFTTTDGSSIYIDLQINGLYQNDLVFIPSGGRAANALCNPVDLTPG
jgi:hypothetical protein